MQINFVQKLIESDIIKTGTELSGRVRRTDLSGQERFEFFTTFLYESSFLDNSGNVIFNVLDSANGRPYKLSSDDIGTIDGMSPDRIGVVYSIASDGSVRPEPVRRGRKPKVKLAMEETHEA